MSALRLLNLLAFNMEVCTNLFKDYLARYSKLLFSNSLFLKINVGSVSGANCKELAAQPDVDGFLVGGASLKVLPPSLSLSLHVGTEVKELLISGYDTGKPLLVCTDYLRDT